jgi:hypothetical protein
MLHLTEDAIHEQYGSGFINYKSTTVQNIKCRWVSLNKISLAWLLFDNYDRIIPIRLHLVPSINSARNAK